MPSISELQSSNNSITVSNSDPSMSTTALTALNQQEPDGLEEHNEDVFGDRQKDDELATGDLLFGSESFEVLRTQSYGYGSDNGSG